MNQLQRGALLCSILEVLELNLHSAIIWSEGSSDLPLEPYKHPSKLVLLDLALEIGGHETINPGHKLDNQLLLVCCLVSWGGRPRGEVSARPFLLDAVALQSWPFEHICSLWFQPWILLNQRDTLQRYGVSFKAVQALLCLRTVIG